MRSIGILGGMFDPVHLGHLNAARAALKYGMDEVLLLPCKTPPHRSQAQASIEDRMEMCRIALRNEKNISVSDADVRDELCYTCDTVDILKQRYPDTEFYWILGADKLKNLKCWRNTEKIFKEIGFLVCPRPGFSREITVEGAELHILPADEKHVSSAQAAEKIQCYDDAIDYLPRDVSRYIAEKGLYQPDYPGILKKRGMKESRLVHTLGVRKTAVDLAARYGARMQAASVAAILHDIAKPMSLDELQEAVEKYNISVPDEFMESNNLLHGPVAAAIAEYELGIRDKEILSAIAHHTAGKKDMTALEEIIYLADAIEPSRRNYPGLAEIRELSEKNLPAAVLLSMQRTRDYVISQGLPFCQETEEAMQCLAEKEKYYV